ncbi:hypothetical protein BKH41_02805 [Helicobacter sp. 12S02232-10]|uniref:glycoside hydrolase family protein n=1 Tax=Helicobacter sp. 12S02232-10 TaxID=1476197 RepID=UPI000BA52641|nr:glycoside hydrolase family protein [Helicobacter sp. 12S02232-10]PAF49610.1 hypothetical protein BKH41_02805 [Helicobacter sp. 12S02232-10]
MKEAILRAITLIKTHEGFSSQIYLDTQKIPTIGYGRNLNAYPLNEAEKEALINGEWNKEEAEAWLVDRVEELYERLLGFGWFAHLNEERQAILLDMAYNLGVKKLLGFKKMIEALKAHDYENAAKEMSESLWAKQTKSRAIKLSALMESKEGGLNV